MREVLLKLADLFHTSGFMSASTCIPDPAVRGLYLVGGILLTATYFTMPGIFFRAIQAKPGLKQVNSLHLWFGIFILVTGLTHLMSVIVLYKPLYVLNAWLRIAAGLAAVMALTKLVPIIATFLTVTGAPGAHESLRLVGEVLGGNELQRMREQNLLKAMRLRALARELTIYANSMDLEIADTEPTV